MPFRGADRRMRARYKVRVPFLLRSNGQEVHGTTRNISLLGISATADSPVQQVQPVQCVLSLPQSARPLVAHGTVIRCEALSHPGGEGSHEIGVFFKEFEGTGESELSRFLYRVSQEEQNAIRAGYRILKQKAVARKRRKRLEALEKRRRRLRRIRRKQRLARQKAARRRTSSRKKRAARTRRR